MSRQLMLLIDRRERLVAKIAAQRTTLAESTEAWRERLALVDKGVGAVRFLKSHPVLPAAATLVITFLRPKKTGKWLLRAVVGWQLSRKLFARERPSRFV